MRISDWSSDVCSSDLGIAGDDGTVMRPHGRNEFAVTAEKVVPALDDAQVRPGMRPDAHDLGQGICGRAVGPEIGRAACRERVCLYVLYSEGAVLLKKKKYRHYNKLGNIIKKQR